MFNRMPVNTKASEDKSNKRNIQNDKSGDWKMGFFTTNKQITDALDDYCDEIDKTQKAFLETIKLFYAKKPLNEVELSAKKVRKKESKCDEYRRMIEYQLFAGSLMPGARGDIFALLEELDKVPNKFEDVANFITLISPEVPLDLHDDIEEIILLTEKCVHNLTLAARQLFRNMKKAHEQAKTVEEIETEIDKLERRLIRRIFQLENISHGQKMMLRELVMQICGISDRAENASDKIEITAIKRKS